MLFKRFFFVVLFIALCGVALLQVLAATNPYHSDFAVGERLKQWQIHDAREACKANPKTCSVIEPTAAGSTVL